MFISLTIFFSMVHSLIGMLILFSMFKGNQTITTPSIEADSTSLSSQDIKSTSPPLEVDSTETTNSPDTGKDHNMK